MADLSTKQRRKMGSHLFAVPKKKVLPIEDRDHVELAWTQVDRTGGLSESERAEARRRILHRAHELGIDTETWHAASDDDDIDASAELFNLEAMALDMPDVGKHPNKVPFSGVMTILDEPSDKAPIGAKKKRVIIPKDVAEAALPTILGMAVDFADDLSGHEPTQKVGLITGATIVGNEFRIEGFLYGADFPDVVGEMKAQKDKLGFSYECKASVKDWKAPVLEATKVIFTGAAIMFKDKAAYTTTSFEASASEEHHEMTLEEIQAAIAAGVAAAVEPLNTEIAALKASNEKLSGLSAAAETHAKVKPHADALRAAADNMQAEGIGMHPDNGHVKLVRDIADHLEASAVKGRIPDAFNGGYMHASADVGNAEHEKRVTELQTQLTASAEREKNLQAQLDEAKQANFNASADPGRQTGAGKNDADTKMSPAERLVARMTASAS